MPQRLDDNLRRGNRSEDLGIHLLRGFAAVAPVPRTCDFGIDAIVTLLRRQKGRILVAEDSFYVQLKSDSVRDIQYRGGQIEWFRNLKLPMFVGWVSTARNSIALYSTHLLSVFMHAEGWKWLRIVRSVGARRTRKKDDGCLTVSLGPPVMTWDVHQAAQPDFLDHAYSILQPWVAAELRNIRTRGLRYVESISWETNTPPRDGAVIMFRAPKPEEAIILALFETYPYLATLASLADRSSARDITRAVRRFARVFDSYKLGPWAKAIDKMTRPDGALSIEQLKRFHASLPKDVRARVKLW